MRLRPRPRSVIDLAAVIALVAGVVGIVTADGSPPRRFALDAGAAWLVSSSIGTVTLVDGHSVEVAARVSIASPGVGMVADQDGAAVAAADASDGDVRWVDPSTLVTDAPARDRLHPQGGLALHVSGGSGYLVDMAAGDVYSARKGPGPRLTHRLDLDEPISSSALDADGRIWVLGADSGSLEWIDGAGRTGAVPDASGAPAKAEVLRVGGLTALIDPAVGRVRAWDGPGTERSACLEVAGGDGTVRAGAAPDDDVVYLASGRDGRLSWSDLETGGCEAGALLDGAAGHGLGTPVPAGDRVFVPDQTTGTVHVFDPRAGVATTTDVLMPPGTPFELVAQDGIVFYNDPASHRAGVVHPDGTFTSVKKYDPADHKGDAGPGEEQPEPPEPPPTTPPVSVIDFPDPEPPPPSPDQPSSGTPDDAATPPRASDAPGAADSATPPSTDQNPPTSPPSAGQGPTPLPGEGPGLSDIRFDTDTYVEGDAIHLTADIDGPFTDCRWTVGATVVTCAPAFSNGPATVSGSTLLTVPGQVSVTLTVTGPGGTTSRNGTVDVGEGGQTEAANLRVLTPQPEPEVNSNPNGDFLIGQDIEVAGDVVGRFTECAWLVGDQSYECVRGDGGPGAETVTGTIPLRTFDNTSIYLSTGEGRLTGPLLVYTHDGTPPFVNTTELTFVQTGPSTTYIRFSVTMRDPESGIELSPYMGLDFNGYSRCSLSGYMINAPYTSSRDLTWTHLSDGFVAAAESTLSCPRAAEGDVIVEGTSFVYADVSAFNGAGIETRETITCGDAPGTSPSSCDEIG